MTSSSGAARALLSALLLIFLGACASDERAPDPRGDDAVTSQNQGPDLLDPETGTTRDADLPLPAPAFELETLDGSKISLAEQRGRVLLVNFWATWCGPCVVEMPDLVELHETYHDEGLTVLGISIEEGETDLVRDFVEEYEITYPIAVDADVADSFGGIYGLPTTFVIDKTGQVIHRVVGLFPIHEMLPRIQLLLMEEV